MAAKFSKQKVAKALALRIEHNVKGKLCGTYLKAVYEDRIVEIRKIAEDLDLEIPLAKEIAKLAWSHKKTDNQLFTMLSFRVSDSILLAEKQ